MVGQTHVCCWLTFGLGVVQVSILRGRQTSCNAHFHRRNDCRDDCTHLTHAGVVVSRFTQNVARSHNAPVLL